MEQDEILRLIVEVIERREGQRRRSPSGSLDTIADAVASSSIVLGSAPAVAMGELDMAGATAMGLSAHNATTAQASGTTQLHASTVLAVDRLLQIPRRPNQALLVLLAQLAAQDG